MSIDVTQTETGQQQQQTLQRRLPSNRRSQSGGLPPLRLPFPQYGSCLTHLWANTMAQVFMSSARLPDAALWDLSGQLLQALLLFERHRIVHIDIKPENIFII